MAISLAMDNTAINSARRTPLLCNAVCEVSITGGAAMPPWYGELAWHPHASDYAKEFPADIIRAMDAQDFASQFNQLYRELYRRAAKRVADVRAQMSPETSALLMHLAQTGPMTLSEMAQHFDRALSTLSVKVAALEADGLLARQPDAVDGRKALIWLSPKGRQDLSQALEVLDARRLSAAAEQLQEAQRVQLLAGLQAFIAELTDANPKLERTCDDNTV